MQVKILHLLIYSHQFAVCLYVAIWFACGSSQCLGSQRRKSFFTKVECFL